LSKRFAGTLHANGEVLQTLDFQDHSLGSLSDFVGRQKFERCTPEALEWVL